MVLIWWTSQIDCDHIGGKLFNVPFYLKETYAERRSRVSRGKLWNYEHRDSHRGIKVPDPWPDTQLATIIKQSYGGIIVDATDLETLINSTSVKTVHSFYGIITDTNLNLFDFHEMKRRVEEFERKFAW